MQLTDDGLRRSAWAAFGLCGGFLLVDVAVGIAGTVVDRGSLDVAGELPFVLIIATFPVVGLLIARVQPRNAIGWVMLAIGFFAFVPTAAYADYGLVVRPGSLPGADVAATLSAGSWAPTIGLVGTYLILLFPDGHLPSPRWRGVGWLSGLSIAWVYLMITLLPGRVEVDGLPEIENPIGVPFVGSMSEVLLPTLLLIPVSFVLCAAALVQRFRRSAGVERQQLKWLTTAGAFVAALYAVGMVASLAKGMEAADPGWLLVLQEVTVTSFVLIPVAIGVAILKHGLYEIDIVINKTVVYGTLAVFITTVYVAIVVGLGTLVGRGDEPNLALSMAATAVVAVAFQPVQLRTQRLANRLVYGERATPYEVLSDFTARVGGSYEADELLPTMARTVAEGVAAARADVWLATAHGLVREGSWPAEASGVQVTAAPGLTDVGGDRVVPVRHRGELLGAISVTKPAGEPLTPVEARLLDDVATQAGLVLRNVRLIEDLRSSRERLVTTQDEERRRLERNLHDGAQQRLVAVALMVRTARAQLGTGSTALGAALDQAADQLHNAIGELRELARGIHPAILTERGLCAAVSSLAERSPVPVDVDCRLAERLPGAVEASLYFAAAEALTNVTKYAHATRVDLRVARHGSVVTLEVHDDGIGGADDAKGSGLRGMVDRLSVVDGAVAVHSPPGGGTRITCRVPVATAVRSGAAPERPLAVGR